MLQVEGLDVNALHHADMQTALAAAVEAEQEEAVAALLACPRTLEWMPNSNLDTPLMLAAHLGHTSIVVR